MGWNLRLRTDQEGGDQLDLSHTFTRGLPRLTRFLVNAEQQYLSPVPEEMTQAWAAKDPQQVRKHIEWIYTCLQAEDEQLPPTHFLRYVDEQHGKRRATQLYVPPGGIPLQVDHLPILKLEGNHHDPEHRDELQMYSVRITPESLNASRADQERWQASYGGPPPWLEEPSGWIAARPIIEVLGYKIQVESLTWLERYEKDLTAFLSFCERAEAAGKPLFLLMHE